MVLVNGQKSWFFKKFSKFFLLPDRPILAYLMTIAHAFWSKIMIFQKVSKFFTMVGCYGVFSLKLQNCIFYLKLKTSGHKRCKTSTDIYKNWFYLDLHNLNQDFYDFFKLWRHKDSLFLEQPFKRSKQSLKYFCRNWYTKYMLFLKISCISDKTVGN